MECLLLCVTLRVDTPCQRHEPQQSEFLHSLKHYCAVYYVISQLKVILFILFIVFSLFLWCQCYLLVMILLKCNPIFSDKLSNFSEIMYPCVCAANEKPNTPHGSRSNHVRIMKLIHHNKSPLSADVSVVAHSLAENVFPQNPLKSIWNTPSLPSCIFVDS